MIFLHHHHVLQISKKPFFFKQAKIAWPKASLPTSGRRMFAALRSSTVLGNWRRQNEVISPHRRRALAGAGSMPDSEELPRKTSKSFCSDSLSLPDDAAEEEAFLLATASLLFFFRRSPLGFRQVDHTASESNELIATIGSCYNSLHGASVNPIVVLA